MEVVCSSQRVTKVDEISMSLGNVIQVVAGEGCGQDSLYVAEH